MISDRKGAACALDLPSAVVLFLLWRDVCMRSEIWI